MIKLEQFLETWGWTEPHRTSSAWDENVLEWWIGDRKLTLYFEESGITYIQFRADLTKDLYLTEDVIWSGELKGLNDFEKLWHWINDEE